MALGCELPYNEKMSLFAKKLGIRGLIKNLNPYWMAHNLQELVTE